MPRWATLNSASQVTYFKNFSASTGSQAGAILNCVPLMNRPTPS